MGRSRGKEWHRVSAFFFSLDQEQRGKFPAGSHVKGWQECQHTSKDNHVVGEQLPDKSDRLRDRR